MNEDDRSILGIDVGGTGVKLAVLRGEKIIWKAKRGYREPSPGDLISAIRDGLAEFGIGVEFAAVGLCVPGLLDERKERVIAAVNVPAIAEIRLDELVSQALDRTALPLHVTNDALATGYDVFATRKLPGRLLVLALGTGVGAAVLDDGVPLKVDSESPGHIGQIDVSIEGVKVIGPDGGGGGLEAYIGAPALRHYYGSDPASKIKPLDPAMRALARAIRICHAIYRPNHVVLAGGLGIRLVRLLPALRKMVETELTSVARPGWTLGAGSSDFYAACGAARLARKAYVDRAEG